MAAKFSQSTCDLCSKSFTDPHLLPCLHVFCRACLQTSQTRKSKTFVCPTCFPKTEEEIEDVVSPGRALSNQDSLKCGNCPNGETEALSFCQNCEVGLCGDCRSAHNKWFKTKRHNLIPLKIEETCSVSSTSGAVPGSPTKARAKHCPFHEDEVIKYFCKTCSVLLCGECVLFEHKDHEYTRLRAAMEAEKNYLVSLLPSLEEAITPLMKSVDVLDERMKNFADKKQTFVDDVNDKFAVLVDTIQAKQEDILSAVTEFTLAKNARFSDQKERMEKLAFATRLALEAGRQSLQVSSAADFFAVYGSVKTVLQSLQEQLVSTQLDPVTDDDVNFKISLAILENMKDSLQNVFTPPCQPSLCKLTEENPASLKEVQKGGESHLIVQTNDYKGSPLCVGGANVCAKFLNADSEQEMCMVTDCGNGKYKVSFGSKTEGTHCLHITVDDQHISGSPFVTDVIDDAKRKHPVLSIPTKDRPTFICLGDDDMIYVAFDDGSVGVYNQLGENKKLITGSQLGITMARGIAVDKKNGLMYVASAGSNNVFKVTLDGRVLKAARSKKSTLIGQPMGLCLTKDKFLLVGDCYKKCIHIFEASELAFIKSIPCSSSVWGLTVDIHNNIHVAATNRVVVFSLVKNTVYEYGKSVLTLAGDVAVSKENLSIVSDHVTNGKVVIFEWTSNTVLASVDGYNHPLGVHVDSSGFVYATESTGKKILRGRFCV